MSKLVSTKGPHFHISGWTKRFRQNVLDTKVVESWNISTQVYFSIVFSQHPQPLYDILQKEIDNLEFVQGVHFEIINSLKIKYLLSFDVSCAEICNFMEFFGHCYRWQTSRI